jgi:hypothetical protein
MSARFYERFRVVRVLRRFVRLSLTSGRLPSLLGREVIPDDGGWQLTSAIERAAVFVADVGLCLADLPLPERRIIGVCILADSPDRQAAHRLGLHRLEMYRRLGVALDRLHEMFCARGILPPPDEDVRRYLNQSYQEESHEQEKARKEKRPSEKSCERPQEVPE